MRIEEDFEEYLINSIQKERDLNVSFFDLVNKFENKISNFDFGNESILIEDYFSLGKGQKTILRRLILENKINQNVCREYITKDGNRKFDFKGIYFFLIEDKPFYIGISKGVVGRICQHLKGKSHNTSTLAYKLGLLRYEFTTKTKHQETRKDLNFYSEVEPIKKFLQKQKIAWISVDNDEELYLFEIYCSMKFKTILNSFETH